MKIGKSWIVLIAAVALTILATVLFSYQGFLVMFFLLILAALFYLYPAICCMKAGRKYNEGDDKGCILYFEKAYKCRRATPTVILTYAYQLIRMGQLKRAEYVLNDLLNRGKKLKQHDQLMTKQNLSLVMYKTERFDKAKELMEEVFEASKTSATYGTLGYYQILADGFLKALPFCEKAYDFNQDDAVIVDNLLTVYIGLARWEDAKKVLDTFVEGPNKKLLELYYHAAQIEKQLGHLKEADKYIHLAQEQKRSFLTTISQEEMDDFAAVIASELH